MIFYCAMAEYYTNCNPKAGVKEKQADKKPKDRRYTKYGVIGFEIWFKDKESDEKLTEQIHCKKINLGEMNNIYSQNHTFIEEVAA